MLTDLAAQMTICVFSGPAFFLSGEIKAPTCRDSDSQCQVGSSHDAVNKVIFNLL